MRKGYDVKNRLVLGTIVGQAVVTLVAIGYGVSAHSSWEAEHQRRIDGERAAVAEMATAMKSARDRLDMVEQELRRCQTRASRTGRGPGPKPASVGRLPVEPHAASSNVAAISQTGIRTMGSREQAMCHIHRHTAAPTDGPGRALAQSTPH